MLEDKSISIWKTVCSYSYIAWGTRTFYSKFKVDQRENCRWISYVLCGNERFVKTIFKLAKISWIEKMCYDNWKRKKINKNEKELITVDTSK